MTAFNLGLLQVCPRGTSTLQRTWVPDVRLSARGGLSALVFLCRLCSLIASKARSIEWFC